MTLTLKDLARVIDELDEARPNKNAQFLPRGMAQDELTDIQSALEAISPDVPRGDGTIFAPDGTPVDDYWFGILLALHHAGGNAAKGVAREWSRTSDRFNADEFDRTWGAIRSDHLNPITMKSVFRLAEYFGWKHPARAFRFRLLDRTAIMTLQPIEWRVKGLFPKVGIGAIFGPSGSGKSFLAIDLAIRLASGDEWFGHKTTPCPVTYVMLEGEAGLRTRSEAWEKVNGEEIPLEFTAVTQSFDISVKEDVEDLAAAVPQGGVIIIDTLNRASPGKDENSSRDMGEVIAGLKTLQDLTKGLVVAVHHTGKDTSRGMRGHSSLPAALDGALEVRRTGEQRSWSVAKAKDGVDGGEVAFKLQSVHLGFDIDNEEMSSCVAVPDASRLISPKEPQGKNQRAAIEALRSKLERGWDWEEAVAAVGANLDVDDNKKSYEARRVLKKCIEKGTLKQDPETRKITG